LTAIIFGSNGQDGYFLNKLLIDTGIATILVSRRNSHFNGDISDFNFVSGIIKKYKPNLIFNLAANSTTNHNALFENYNTICKGVDNILEASRLYSPNSKIFISGSALQFQNYNLPIDEHSLFEAKSPYAVARIHSVYSARYYRNTFNMNVYVGYFFNHDSELRSEKHINQKIVTTLKKISNGSSDKLIIGAPNVIKEFNFAGDIVEAVLKIIFQDDYFEFVIGCGIGYTIMDWIIEVAKILNLDPLEYIVIDNSYITEFDKLVCRPNLLKSIGWHPKYDIKQLAKRMVNKNNELI
jgi:GDPmannose 4,6-dehydratase